MKNQIKSNDKRKSAAQDQKKVKAVRASGIRHINGNSVLLKHVTSIDGSILYNDISVPRRWRGGSPETYYRYTSKRYNTVVEKVAGQYLNLDDGSRLLCTNKGLDNGYGVTIIPTGVEKLTRKKYVYLKWYDAKHEVIEIPSRQVKSWMDVEDYDKRGVSLWKERLVNGRVQRYYQLQTRCNFELPWFVQDDVTEKFKLQKSERIDLFTNDDGYYGVAEQTCIDSQPENQYYLQDTEYAWDAFDVKGNIQDIALKTWEQDNPEYQTYNGD